MLVGACLVALVPLVAQPFLEVSVEAFDDIDVGRRGRLARRRARARRGPGARPGGGRAVGDPAAGRLGRGRRAHRRAPVRAVDGRLAVGTFAAALLLIPLLGTQRTFIVFALLLAVSAASALPLRYALVPAAIAALLAVPPGVTKDLADGRVLAERETEYQYARVVELDDGERRLELNEGQAFHSVYRPDTVLTGQRLGRLPVDAVRRARPRRRARSRSSATAPARRSAPTGATSRRTAIDGVEIDPELTELGRDWFGLRDRPGLRLHPRRRAAVPAAQRPPLRHDLRRRLPPAVHPVLPDHARVLRARARRGWTRAAQ